MSWRPRASSIAGYAYCQARAAFDKAIQAGTLTLPDAGPRDTKYADLGTLIHARAQALAGCAMCGPSENPGEVQAQRLSAATLFGGDDAALQRAVDAAAQATVSALPPSPDGKPWLAEFSAKSRMLTGHIDFLSQDHTVLIDLKTTSRKPDHNRVKGEHYLQMLAYKLLVPEIQRAHILYVDSSGGRWTLLSPPIDFTSTDAAVAGLRLNALIRRLRSKTLESTAMPAPGGHCSGCFCPYTSVCKDALIPGPGVVIDRAPVAAHPKVAEPL